MNDFYEQKIDFLTMYKIFIFALHNLYFVLDNSYFVFCPGQKMFCPGRWMGQKFSLQLFLLYLFSLILYILVNDVFFFLCFFPNPCLYVGKQMKILKLFVAKIEAIDVLNNFSAQISFLKP